MALIPGPLLVQEVLHQGSSEEGLLRLFVEAGLGLLLSKVAQKAIFRNSPLVLFAFVPPFPLPVGRFLCRIAFCLLRTSLRIS